MLPTFSHVRTVSVDVQLLCPAQFVLDDAPQLRKENETVYVCSNYCSVVRLVGMTYWGLTTLGRFAVDEPMCSHPPAFAEFCSRSVTDRAWRFGIAGRCSGDCRHRECGNEVVRRLTLVIRVQRSLKPQPIVRIQMSEEKQPGQPELLQSTSTVASESVLFLRVWSVSVNTAWFVRFLYT